MYQIAPVKTVDIEYDQMIHNALFYVFLLFKRMHNLTHFYESGSAVEIGQYTLLLYLPASIYALKYIFLYI